MSVFGIGSQELMVILLLALLLFGAQKLPELARGLGRSVKEFRGAMEEGGQDEPLRPSGSSGGTPRDPGRTCTSCRAALESGWNHCPGCGAAVALAGVDPVSPPPR